MKLKNLITLGCMLCALQTFAQPSNDNCIDAIELIPDSVISMSSYSFDGATRDVVHKFAYPTLEEVFFKFTATDFVHNIIVDVSNSINWMSAGLVVMEGDCASTFTSLTGINVPMVGSNAKSVCRYDGYIPGNEYYIMLTNSNGDNLGDYDIMVTRVAEVGEFCFTAEQVDVGVTVSGSNYFSTENGEMFDVLPEDLCAITLENGMWYEFIAPVTGDYNILFNNMDYIGGSGSNVAIGHQIGVFESANGDCMNMQALTCDSSEYYYADLNMYLIQGNVYRVVVEGDAGCLVSYDMIITSPNAGINEIASSKFNLYPSNASTVVNIELPTDYNYVINVISTSGVKLIDTESNFSSQIELNVNELNSGMYFVRITGNGENKSLRFSK